MDRRSLIAGGALAAASLIRTDQAYSQAPADFPNRPITLIVSWAPGSPIDLLHRALAEAAARHLGQPVVVDNKVGAAGTVGPATMAATAKPDGYTISHIPLGIFLLPLQQKVSWDPLKDFTYIIHLSSFVGGIVARSDAPFKTMPELIQHARENPGKVTYGTPGAGSQIHIIMQLIAQVEGIQWTHVPFGTGIETAVLGGHVTAAASALPVMRPFLDSGQLRALAVATGERRPWLPDVPTLLQLGYKFISESTFGIAGPRGIDPAIVKKIHGAFKLALEDVKVREFMARADYPYKYMDTETYTKFAETLFNEQRGYLKLIGFSRKD